MLRAMLVFLLLVAPLAAQTKVSTVQWVTGLESVRKVGTLTVAEKASQIEFVTIGLIEITSDAANINCRVEDESRSEVKPVPVDAPDFKGKIFALPNAGKYWIRIVCIDFQKNIYTDEYEKLVVGEPKPNPKPDPTPIPDDQFGNIGKQVAEWTKGLKANQAIGAVYLKWATNLRGADINSTVNETAAKLKADLAATPGYDSSYAAFSAGLNKDLAARWAIGPMSKGVLADYYTAIAAGLGVTIPKKTIQWEIK